MRIREKDGKGEGGDENIYEGKEGGIMNNQGKIAYHTRRTTYKRKYLRD